MKSNIDQWEWMKNAFHQTLSKMNDMISTLGNQKLENGFHLVKRSYRKLDSLKQILYSMKQYGREDFDRLNHTIFSKTDWKPTRIHQRRTPNKISDIPSRTNKITDKGNLLSFGV